MKQIKATIDPKTGKLSELKAEGYAGTSCLEATKFIREKLGITAEPTPTDEMYVTEEQQQKLEGS